MRRALLLALAFVAAPAHAQIYQCANHDGTMRFVPDDEGPGCTAIYYGGMQPPPGYQPPLPVTAPPPPAAIVEPPPRAADLPFSGYLDRSRRFLKTGQRHEEVQGRGSLARLKISESGESAGVQYNIDYGTGGGGFGIWTVECSVDAIHRFRECRLENGPVEIRQRSNGQFVLYVGEDHYPGSKIYIRLDGGRIHTTTGAGWSGAQARVIARELASAKSAGTRFWRWPYRSDVDHVVYSNGLMLALQYLDFATSKK